MDRQTFVQELLKCLQENDKRVSEKETAKGRYDSLSPVFDIANCIFLLSFPILFDTGNTFGNTKNLYKSILFYSLFPMFPMFPVIFHSYTRKRYIFCVISPYIRAIFLQGTTGNREQKRLKR